MAKICHDHGLEEPTLSTFPLVDLWIQQILNRLKKNLTILLGIGLIKIYMGIEGCRIPLEYLGKEENVEVFKLPYFTSYYKATIIKKANVSVKTGI